MTPETPDPRLALEARLTALLLGELSGAEAGALRQAIEDDPALSKLYGELAQTIKLVRETAATPSPESAPQPEPLRMSEEKRQKLLAQFKTVKPAEFEKPEKRWRIKMTLLELVAVVAILAILAGLMLPALGRAKSKAISSNVRSNLHQIDMAKQMWAEENKAAPDATPTMEDLKPYLSSGQNAGPKPVVGESYVVGKVGEPAAAEVAAKDAKRAFGRIPESVAANGRGDQVMLFSDGKLAYAPPQSGPKPGEQPEVYNLNVVGYVNVSLSNGFNLTPNPLDSDGEKVSSAKPASTALSAAPTHMDIVLPSAGGTEGANGTDLAKLDSSTYYRNLNQWGGQATGAGGGGGGGAGNQNPGFQSADPAWGTKLDRADDKPGSGNKFVARYDFVASPSEPLSLDLAKNRAEFPGRQDKIELPAATPPAQLETINAEGKPESEEALRHPLLENQNVGAQGGDVVLKWGYQAPQPAPSPAPGGSGGRRGGFGEVANSRSAAFNNNGTILLPEKLNEAGVQLAGEPAAATPPPPSFAATTATAEEQSGGQDRPKVAPTVLPGAPTRGYSLLGPKEVDMFFGGINGESVARYSPATPGGVPQDAESLGRTAMPAPLGAPAQPPPQLAETPKPNIQAKFAETTPGDSKALGFNWNLGDVNFANGNVIGSGGTQPSLATRQAPSASDGVLAGSSNLRNPQDAPTIGTLTGIMTEPEFHGVATGVLQPLDDKSVAGGRAVASGGTQPSAGTSTVTLDPDGRRVEVVADDKTRENVGRVIRDLDRSKAQSEGLQSDLSESAKVPLLGDLPMAGRAFRSENGRQAKMKVDDLQTIATQNTAQAPAGGFSGLQSGVNGPIVNQTVTIVPNEPTDQKDMETLGRKPELALGLKTPPITAAPEVNIKAKFAEINQNDDKGLGFNWALGAPANAGEPPVAAAAQEPRKSDLTSDEAAGKRLADLTAKMDEGARKEKERTLLLAEADLERAKKFNDLLALRAAQERVEEQMPKSTMVELIEHAEGKAPARIKVDRDGTDVAGVDGRGGANGAYDPYFVQTELEVLQSELVLDKVVDKLNLDQAWGEKGGSNKKLSKAEARAILRKNLDVKAVKDTSLVDIHVKGQKPEDAARIANEVAKTYEDYRRDERKKLIMGGIDANRKEMESQGAKVLEKEKEVERLRAQLAVADTKLQSSATVPGMTLEPMNVMHYNSVKIEQEASLAKKEALLKQLKALSPDELRQTLPTLLPDPTLPTLLQESVIAESHATTLLNNYGPNHPEVMRAQGLKADLDNQINQRIAGFMAGLETEVKTARAIVTNRAAKVEEARKNDAALAERLKKEAEAAQAAKAALNPPKPAASPLIPQPEVSTAENAFSTFSLNVADVAFKLAAASLEKGVMPDPSNIRTEEFINAFDYRDPEPGPGAPLAFAWERVRYPFAQNRDLLRFAVKTAAAGRQPGRPMNIVLLLDNSGSMERADRVAIIRQALRVLASKLEPQDRLSVVTFARTAHLRVDGVPGSQAAQVAEEIGGLTPQGGTNLEEAMRLAYETAQRHYLANGVNRVVLMTDGAANLGNVDPVALKEKVDANRKQGIALDCFGIGWEGYNDDLLETLSRNGDGRYGFINTPEEATTDFVGQLAGALNVAASDVKVQVEFNPKRVANYRQIGYAKHQLTKEQFRDNTVNAAQIAAAESGNALYTVEVNPAGEGPIAIVRVRYRVPGTQDYHEHEWAVPYQGNALGLEQASIAMRLAGTASAFAEWLGASPFAGDVTPDRLLSYLNGVPEAFGADQRPKKLEWMIRQAKSLTGK